MIFEKKNRKKLNEYSFASFLAIKKNTVTYTRKNKGHHACIYWYTLKRWCTLYRHSGTMTNTEDPDEMPHKAAYNKGLQCFLT